MTFSQCIISSRALSSSTIALLVIISFIVIITLPTPARTQPLTTQSRHVPHQRYCSTSLFEAIRTICNGRYNSLSNVYPESFGNQNRASLLRRLLPDDDVIYRPSFGGPVHECCRRPCGYSELQSYCAD
ncbi:LIRP-like [Musca vetustissima]|uniref:LIRP-like n=1 Tax=Musca vetustissima TaxID=27455 RepID=UPI002AB66AE5|nr:LIRP-like [Musca vetustissima]XP_061402832.1 LIRP-like [Musca vetustissima]